MAVWRGAAAFEGASSVKTWMFGIARRRTFQMLRRPAERAELTEAKSAAVSADLAPGPEDVALMRAEVDLVSRAISALPPLHREVVMLVCVHEMTGLEAAAVLGVPVGTVKSRLSHARAAIAASLHFRSGEED